MARLALLAMHDGAGDASCAAVELDRIVSWYKISGEKLHVSVAW